jgi:hypothetical protein
MAAGSVTAWFPFSPLLTAPIGALPTAQAGGAGLPSYPSQNPVAYSNTLAPYGIALTVCGHQKQKQNRNLQLSTALLLQGKITNLLFPS